jgi:hypothetical protein
MTPDPQEVLNLAAAIVETKATLNELNKKWEKLFSSAPNGASVNAPRAARDNTFPSKLKAILSGEPGRLFTIGQVADIAGVETLKVGRTLFRLANTGHIDNPERGLYRAKHGEEIAA